MRKLLLNIAFLTVSVFLFSQEINLVITKDEAQIGEPFALVLSVVSKQKPDSIGYFPQTSFFPAKSSSNKSTTSINSPYELEILTPFNDTNYIENGEYIWKGIYQLTGWDSAYVVIPPEKIYINDSLYYSPAGLIQITSPIADASKPIFDIHEDFTEIDNSLSISTFLKKYWWLILIIVAIIGFLVYHFLKNKKQPVETVLSLRQRTLQQIDELEQKKGYETDLKEYYFELSVILRSFFAEHYSTPIMDKTTPQIERVLRQKGLDSEMIKLTRQLLSQSDMVKFAKSKPGINEILLVTNNARRVVNEVADLDLNDE